MRKQVWQVARLWTSARRRQRVVALGLASLAAAALVLSTLAQLIPEHVASLLSGAALLTIVVVYVQR
jgi:hypothetical protein